MSRWFRHYAGMCRDDKLVRVALRSKQTIERVVWIYAAILESAAEIDDGGKFEIDAPEIAYFLRCDEGDVEAIVACLADMGRLDGQLVARWKDRQFQSDRSAERTRRYRDRNKTENHNPVPSQRMDVTSQTKLVTSQKRPCDSPETETEAETKEDANASSTRDGLTDFKKKIMAAFHAAGSTAFPDTSRASIWLERGWKPEICVAVIAEILSRNKSVTALKYFEQPIADAHEKPVARPQAPAEKGKPGSAPTAGKRLSIEENREFAKANGQAYVLRETPAGEAWNAYKRRTTGRSQWWDAHGGNFFPSEFPPAEEQAA